MDTNKYMTIKDINMGNVEHYNLDEETIKFKEAHEKLMKKMKTLLIRIKNI